MEIIIAIVIILLVIVANYYRRERLAAPAAPIRPARPTSSADPYFDTPCINSDGSPGRTPREIVEWRNSASGHFYGESRQYNDPRIEELQRLMRAERERDWPAREARELRERMAMDAKGLI